MEPIIVSSRCVAGAVCPGQVSDRVRPKKPAAAALSPLDAPAAGQLATVTALAELGLEIGAVAEVNLGASRMIVPDLLHPGPQFLESGSHSLHLSRHRHLLSCIAGAVCPNCLPSS
jgi:Zn ribbon nucleic-acid-binding protein